MKRIITVNARNVIHLSSQVSIRLPSGHEWRTYRPLCCTSAGHIELTTFTAETTCKKCLKLAEKAASEARR